MRLQAPCYFLCFADLEFDPNLASRLEEWSDNFFRDSRIWGRSKNRQIPQLDVSSHSPGNVLELVCEADDCYGGRPLPGIFEDAVLMFDNCCCSVDPLLATFAMEWSMTSISKFAQGDWDWNCGLCYLSNDLVGPGFYTEIENLDRIGKLETRNGNLLLLYPFYRSGSDEQCQFGKVLSDHIRTKLETVEKIGNE